MADAVAIVCLFVKYEVYEWVMDGLTVLIIIKVLCCVGDVS